MFTHQNTYWTYTDAELEILNDALVIRMARGEDEKSASDAINNAWMGDDTTVDDLV